MCTYYSDLYILCCSDITVPFCSSRIVKICLNVCACPCVRLTQPAAHGEQSQRAEAAVPIRRGPLCEEHPGRDAERILRENLCRARQKQRGMRHILHSR